MKVYTLIVGSFLENCYVVVNQKNEAIVIDPGSEATKIIEFLQPYKVVGILVTHHHFDHIGALEELENIYHLKSNQKIEEFSYEVILTPGHTLDSLSFYFPNEKILFVGDFIFRGAIGRTDLGGDDKLMKNSIQNLLSTIPLDTTLYPGHGDATTLEAEKTFLEKIFLK